MLRRIVRRHGPLARDSAGLRGGAGLQPVSRLQCFHAQGQLREGLREVHDAVWGVGCVRRGGLLRGSPAALFRVPIAALTRRSRVGGEHRTGGARLTQLLGAGVGGCSAARKSTSASCARLLPVRCFAYGATDARGHAWSNLWITHQSLWIVGALNSGRDAHAHRCEPRLLAAVVRADVARERHREQQQQQAGNDQVDVTPHDRQHRAAAQASMPAKSAPAAMYRGSCGRSELVSAPPTRP